jgi:hypothetical protein
MTMTPSASISVRFEQTPDGWVWIMIDDADGRVMKRSKPFSTEEQARESGRLALLKLLKSGLWPTRR